MREAAKKSKKSFIYGKGRGEVLDRDPFLGKGKKSVGCIMLNIKKKAKWKVQSNCAVRPAFSGEGRGDCSRVGKDYKPGIYKGQ